MHATDRSTDDAEDRVRQLDVQITGIEREDPGGVSGSIWRVPKGARSRTKGLLMACKILDMAQTPWRPA